MAHKYVYYVKNEKKMSTKKQSTDERKFECNTGNF